MRKIHSVGRLSWRTALRDPVYFAQKVLGIYPHPGQAAWLRNSNRPENLLVTGNRWGKSFVQAIKIIHRALFKIRSRVNDNTSRYTIVAASITQDQANIVFNTALRMIRGNTLLPELLTSVKRTPYPEIIFGNGSIITARTTQNRGHYLLGNDYDFFTFDEAAFETEPEYLINDVIMMRLADRDGRLDLISTPNGKNWFYRRFLELQQDSLRGYVQAGDSRDNPYLSEFAIRRRLTSLPADRVAQNIAGLFIDNERTVFSSGDIDCALHGALQQPRPERIYYTGWDLARKRTHTVGITVDVTELPYQVVAVERFNNRDWSDVVATVRRIHRIYPGKTIIDATGLGDVIMSELSDIAPIGIIFTPRQKGELLSNLILLHNRREIIYPNVTQRDTAGRLWSLEMEMREICWENNNEYDAVMALALAVWPRRRVLMFPEQGPLPVRVSHL